MIQTLSPKEPHPVSKTLKTDIVTHLREHVDALFLIVGETVPVMDHDNETLGRTSGLRLISW